MKYVILAVLLLVLVGIVVFYVVPMWQKYNPRQPSPEEMLQMQQLQMQEMMQGGGQGAPPGGG